MSGTRIVLAFALFVACDAEPDNIAPDDTDLQPREVDAAPSLRLITANLEHVTWENALARNGFAEDDGLVLAWLQTHYLTTLESPGASIFHTQESSQKLPETGGALWPTVLHLLLGTSATSPAYAWYDSWYDPINYRAVGSWGNAIATNLPVAQYGAWDLDEGCDGAVQRSAQAVRTQVNGVDVWSVNVHFEICPENEDFSVNACNLDNLLSHLEALPADDVVLVSGDFNIHQEPRSEDQWCPGEIHPARFHEMLRELRARQFIRIDGDGPDHVFLRDRAFHLSSVSSRSFAPIYEPDDESYLVSDHAFIETDVDVGGAGMSPSFLPLFVTLN